MIPQLHIRLALPLALACLAAPAAAFHEQGAANCSGCHVMHESIDGLPVDSGEPAGLLAESPSDVCLLCHAQDAGSVLGTDPLLPPPEKGAGNFVFLFEDNINDAPDGGLNPIIGDAAGHNIVAPGHGLAADSRYALSPGGSFPADLLGCTSCHDPHGNTNFRMLHGAVEVQGGVALFSVPSPSAEGIDLDGREQPTTHTAYRDGMSLWCGNCHGAYHQQELSDFEHPSNEFLGSEERDWYNAYNGDDDATGGTASLAYLPEVPLEDPAAAVGSRAGASPSSRVMCLSCHRAHASSAPASGRWDFNVSLLLQDGDASGSWPIPSPYASPNQGSLCRKCHESGAGED